MLFSLIYLSIFVLKLFIDFASTISFVNLFQSLVAGFYPYSTCVLTQG